MRRTPSPENLLECRDKRFNATESLLYGYRFFHQGEHAVAGPAAYQEPKTLVQLRIAVLRENRYGIFEEPCDVLDVKVGWPYPNRRLRLKVPLRFARLVIEHVAYPVFEPKKFYLLSHSSRLNLIGSEIPKL